MPWMIPSSWGGRFCSTVWRWLFLGGAAFFFSAGAWAEASPGDAQAKKLTRGADGNYAAKDFSAAVKKLGQAASLCETRGCTPAVHAQIYAVLAIVHWVGTEDYDSAVEALRTMVRLDPVHALDRRATPELRAALDTARTDVRREGEKSASPPVDAGAQPAARAQPPPPQEDDEPVDKEEAFRRQVEARKAQHAHEADETRRRMEAEAAQFAAEEKKAEAARKGEEARKAAEEKRDAARRAADEKRETARLAAEQKKAEAARKAYEEKRAAEEKIAAAKKATEDKKTEEARKAEEARQAREDERLRTPPPAGKLQETPWHQQTMGYPLPVYVKLPPPPPGVEPVRIEVTKVVTEYYGPATPVPVQFELKPLGNGGYGGLLPCDATSVEGTVTYFTIAVNKYNNLVAIGASPQKPNKVKVKAAFSGQFPHLPGEMPPKACSREGEAKTASAPGPTCAADNDCPDGGVCADKACAAAKAAPPVPASSKPRWRACLGCEIGARRDAPPRSIVFILVAAAAGLVRVARRRRTATRSCERAGEEQVP